MLSLSANVCNHTNYTIMPRTHAHKTNKALIELGLNENYIRDAGASAVAEMLQVNSVLTTLWLGDNMIGDKGAIVSACVCVCVVVFGVAFCVQALGDLVKVSLRSDVTTTSNRCTKNCHKNEMYQCLICPPSPRRPLARAPPHPTPQKAIAEALQRNEFDTAVQRLVLADNDIGDDGAVALAEVVKHSSVLEYLDLSGNTIGDGKLCARPPSLEAHVSRA